MEAVLPMPVENKEELVQALRNGIDTSKQIVETHLRLAMAIAASYAQHYPSHRADLESVAALALTRAVDRVRTHKFVLENNNITPFIYRTVRPALRKYVLQTKMIPYPSQRLSEAKAKGEEVKFDKVVGMHLTNIVMHAKHETPSLEFREIVELCIDDEMERQVVELKFQEYNLEEIAQKLGLSSRRRSQEIWDRFRTKFSRLWRG